jgi:hypothetical protein
MLKTFTVAFLAIAMSVGLADAKGRHVAKQTTPPAMSCNAEQPAADTCACGPAKTVCDVWPLEMIIRPIFGRVRGRPKSKQEARFIICGVIA